MQRRSEDTGKHDEGSCSRASYPYRTFAWCSDRVEDYRCCRPITSDLSFILGHSGFINKWNDSTCSAETIATTALTYEIRNRDEDAATSSCAAKKPGSARSKPLVVIKGAKASLKFRNSCKELYCYASNSTVTFILVDANCSGSCVVSLEFSQ